MSLRQFTGPWAIAIFLVIGYSAEAQTWNWTNPAGGAWSTPANWSPPGPPASALSTTLQFSTFATQPAAGYTSINDLGPFILNSMQFDIFGATNPSILLNSSAPANVALFTMNGPQEPTIVNNGTSNVTFNTLEAQINNGAVLGILGTNLGNITFTTGISQTGVGNGKVEVAVTGPSFLGSGAVVAFNGAGSYAGGTFIAAGNISLNNAAGLGIGPVTVASSTNTMRFTTTGLTVANDFQIDASLNLTGVNAATFSGAFTGLGGINLMASGLAANPLATFTNAGNSFTGDVTARPVGNSVAGVTLSGNGSFTGTTLITMYSNCTLLLSNATTAMSNRINAAANLTLHRANLTMTGNAGAATSESMGLLTTTGFGSLTISPNAAQQSSVSFSAWARPLFATALFSSVGLAGSGPNTGSFIVASNPGGDVGGNGAPGSNTVNVLPYAIGNTGTSGSPSVTFVRWDPGTMKITPLVATEYATNLYTTTVSAPNVNMRRASITSNPDASSSVIRANTAVNALVLSSDTTNTGSLPSVGVSVGGPFPILVGGGAILSTNSGSVFLPVQPSIINVSSLNFGATPGYIHTLAPLTINSPITGSAGVVKSSAAELYLGGNNTFMGDLSVNAGNLRFHADANLGAASNQLYLNGGVTSQLRYFPHAFYNDATGTGLTINRQINLGPAGSAFGNAVDNATMNYSGLVTGSGGALTTGTGAINFTNAANTYSGVTVIANSGTGAMADASLGTNPNLVMAGGVLAPLASYSSTKNYLVTASSAFNVTTTTLTIDGIVGSQVNANNLSKVGAGTLVLTNANSFLGNLTIGDTTPTVRIHNPLGAETGGAVVLNGPNGALPMAGQAGSTSTFTLNTGTLLHLDNSGAAANINNNRIGSVGVSLAGGEMRLTGNANGDVVEFIGTSTTNGLNISGSKGSVVTVDQPASGGPGQTTTLISTALSGTAGPVLFRGTNLGAASGDRAVILFGTNPAQVNGMIPSALLATNAAGDATDFATTVPVGTQFSLVPFTGYAGALPATGGAATAVYDNNGLTTVGAGGTAAQAIRLAAGGAIDVGANTLTMNGTATHILALPGNGGISSSTGTGTLDFGANVARVTVSGPATTLSLGTAAAPLAMTGTSGFRKFGQGTLTVFGTAASNMTTVSVMQGTLVYGNANAFANGTLQGVAGALTATHTVDAGATLDFSQLSAGTIYVPRFASSFGTVNIGSKTMSTGFIPATLNNLVGTAASKLRIGVPLSEVPGNTFGGSIITLTGNNSGFAGGIEIYNGSLTVNSKMALGTGTSPIVLGDPSGAFAELNIGPIVDSFSRNIVLPGTVASSRLRFNATQASFPNLTVSSNISLGHTLLLDVLTFNALFSGNMTLSGNLTGTGGVIWFAGNVAFSGTNTYSGIFDLAAGSGLVCGIGASSTGTSGPLGVGNQVRIDNFGGLLRADGGARTIDNNFVTTLTTAPFGFTGVNDITLTGTFNYSTLTSPLNMRVLNKGVTTMSGVITGSQAFIKNGPGTLILASPTGNAISGATFLNAGLLRLSNMTGNAVGAVTINDGAILGGMGSALGPVTVNPGGILAPGASVGTLRIVGTTSLSNNAILDMEFNGYSPVPAPLNSGGSTNLLQHDQLQSGGFTAGNFVLKVDELGSLTFTPNATYSWTVATSNFTPTIGTVTLDFAEAPIFAYYFGLGGVSVTTNAGQLNLNLTAVPEPASVLGICAAGCGLAAWMQRRRRSR